MAIEIVDFPIKNGDFPWQNVSSPEGNPISGGFLYAFMTAKSYPLAPGIRYCMGGAARSRASTGQYFISQNIDIDM